MGGPNLSLKIVNYDIHLHVPCVMFKLGKLIGYDVPFCMFLTSVGFLFFYICRYEFSSFICKQVGMIS